MAELTLGERDRRWAEVAVSAADAGLDAVFVPLGNGIDARYLTKMRNSIVVLPTDGREPLVVTDRRASNDWVPSPRHTVRAWTDMTVDLLKDGGLAGARIGVAGLRRGRWSHVSAPNGVAVYSPLQAAEKALPEAQFVDATDVLGSVRAKKSAEEVECLRAAAAIADVGLERLAEVVGAGAEETAVYASALQSVLALGSPYREHRFTVDGKYCPVPGRRLERGSVLTASIIGVEQGYMCKETQSYVVGGSSDGWMQLADAQEAAFRELLSRLNPGLSLPELRRAVSDVGQEGVAVSAEILGAGLGDDGPVVAGVGADGASHDVSLLPGMALQVDLIATGGPEGRGVRWGTGVLVTDSGASRFSERDCRTRFCE